MRTWMRRVLNFYTSWFVRSNRVCVYAAQTSRSPALKRNLFFSKAPTSERSTRVLQDIGEKLLEKEMLLRDGRMLCARHAVCVFKPVVVQHLSAASLSQLACKQCVLDILARVHVMLSACDWPGSQTHWRTCGGALDPRFWLQ